MRHGSRLVVPDDSDGRFSRVVSCRDLEVEARAAGVTLFAGDKTRSHARQGLFGAQVGSRESLRDESGSHGKTAGDVGPVELVLKRLAAMRECK